MPACTAVILNLEAGKQFKFRVRAWNSVGEGRWSDVSFCSVPSREGSVPGEEDIKVCDQNKKLADIFAAHSRVHASKRIMKVFFLIYFAKCRFAGV
jgi:hypothetical protein